MSSPVPQSAEDKKDKEDKKDEKDKKDKKDKEARAFLNAYNAETLAEDSVSPLQAVCL